MKFRIAIALVIASLAGYAGRGVSGATLLGLFDLLVTTAGIVFGVAGAWMALVHATELRSETPQTGRFRDLLRSMLVSGVTVSVVLVAHGVHAVFSESSLLTADVLPVARAFAFGGWSFFALAQVWSIFATLPSALHALGEIVQRRDEQRVIGSLPPPQRPRQRDLERKS